MNGANASTLAAAIKSRPVAQRKITKGISQRFPPSLRQRLSTNSGIEAKALPKTMMPCWIFPRLRIMLDSEPAYKTGTSLPANAQTVQVPRAFGILGSAGRSGKSRAQASLQRRGRNHRGD